jgi:hypothetical protein
MVKNSIPIYDEEAGNEVSAKPDAIRVVYHHYPPGSIPAVATQTGIPEGTIYRLIREQKIQAAKNQEGFLSLDDHNIAKLEQWAGGRKNRKLIFETAEENGESKEATKKWLQRHRDMPNKELREQLEHWLGISPGRRPQKP